MHERLDCSISANRSRLWVFIYILGLTLNCFKVEKGQNPSPKYCWGLCLVSQSITTRGQLKHAVTVTILVSAKFLVFFLLKYIWFYSRIMLVTRTQNTNYINNHTLFTNGYDSLTGFLPSRIAWFSNWKKLFKLNSAKCWPRVSKQNCGAPHNFNKRSRNNLSYFYCCI